MAEKIQARLIIEILGRPEDHVKASLHSLIEKLSKEKGVRLLEKTLNNPMPIEDAKDLFTAFADVLLEFDSLSAYISVLFAYMPSNIEIIHPENFEIKNSDLSEMGNNLLQRLHHYDSLVKGMMNERVALVNKLREVAPHLFEQNQPPIQQQKQESLEEALEEKPKEKTNPEEKEGPKNKSKKSKPKKEE